VITEQEKIAGSAIRTLPFEQLNTFVACEIIKDSANNTRIPMKIYFVSITLYTPRPGASYHIELHIIFESSLSSSHAGASRHHHTSVQVDSALNKSHFQHAILLLERHCLLRFAKLINHSGLSAIPDEQLACVIIIAIGSCSRMAATMKEELAHAVASRWARTRKPNRGGQGHGCSPSFVRTSC